MGLGGPETVAEGVPPELTLLGRVSFRGNEITGPRIHGLLALLAGDLRSGRSVGSLVAGLWPEVRPEHPVKAVQILVSRARAQLGAEVIASTPTGYRLALGESRVDAAAVLANAEAARRCAQAGEHLAALTAAEAGLALCQGIEPADGDDPVARLRTERAATGVELGRIRAMALARLGRFAAAVGPLSELAGQRPRDEELLLELLRAEQATAGVSAALARYEDYRRGLREELGTEPGAALRRLHSELLRATQPAVRRGVPHEPNPLLGREEDLARVAELLRGSRVTSIVGTGGLGKTRLAYAVSRAADHRLVHIVGLAGIGADEEVALTVAAALGADRADPVRGIARVLAGGSALLVLDNCEHVVRGVAELVRALVALTPEARFLTTTRTPLGLSSEAVYPLPELSPAATVALFTQRARAARPTVPLPADTVAELCQRLDGLPLAVELAAARVRVLSVPEIARRLDDRFSLLAGGSRDAPPRHHTLRAALDWSWTLLEPAGQAALRALSIFPGGFTAAGAAELLDAPDVLAVLEHLVDQSLLKVVDTPLGARFRMLAAVREFGAAQRAEAGEQQQVSAGFLRWATEFGRRHHEEVFQDNPAETAELIRAEQDNLTHALRLATELADGPATVAATALLSILGLLDNNLLRLLQVVELSGPVLSRYRPSPELTELTRTALTLCSLHNFQGSGLRAGRALLALRRLPPGPPDSPIRALAQVLTVLVQVSGADDPLLRALCERPEPLLAATAEFLAGYLWERDGVPERALRCTEKMLATLPAQVPLLVVLARGRLAELHLQLDRADLALTQLRTALAELDALRLSPDFVGTRAGLMLASLHLGALEEAEEWLPPGVPGDQADYQEAFRLGVRAEILLSRGEIEIALRQYRDLAGPPEPAAVEPWALLAQGVAVVAHAQHGRLDQVAGLVQTLPARLSAVLATPASPRTTVEEFPAAGVLLVALALVRLDRGDPAVAARLIALAERFRYSRAFQPTMSAERIRDTAVRADPAAYAEAVLAYAGRSQHELQAAARALVELCLTG
ncbi:MULTISPECIES: BTAD domain-containing putative transcriptional regulator [unclassified Crossiella]|uniref:ATP-binding protein n=1 Tax=unclassified Crossiella TaxID=2620835 RepID=UPI001FFE3A71|nr:MULTISPECIES: BTAD domain-containing putative transcriptional regulator [unclassified Crossiella]MCK2238945.1 AfsR/SARP family transcriptional regulator [Crossiella sp. S99.2]MCK2251485.1 AfsR/SARP family transcriptional regulator [Crossiella sp. S99.1]